MCGWIIECSSFFTLFLFRNFRTGIIVTFILCLLENRKWKSICINKVKLNHVCPLLYRQVFVINVDQSHAWTGPRQLTANKLISNQLTQQAEKGRRRNTYLFPEPSCPSPHFVTKSLCDKIMAVGAQDDLGGQQTFAQKMTWCIAFLRQNWDGFFCPNWGVLQKKKKKKVFP